MADEQQTDKKSSSKLKALLVMVGILTVEAALIIGAMVLFGGPQVSEADDALAGTAGIPPEEMITEILILEERLPNSKTGVTYVYDTEVYVQVRKKNADLVTQELEQFKNEIRSEIIAIWRTSEPDHFREPQHETLTRKVCALLNDRFKTAAEGEGPILEKCVIVMDTGFRVDS